MNMDIKNELLIRLKTFKETGLITEPMAQKLGDGYTRILFYKKSNQKKIVLEVSNEVFMLLVDDTYIYRDFAYDNVARQNVVESLIEAIELYLKNDYYEVLWSIGGRRLSRRLYFNKDIQGLKGLSSKIKLIDRLLMAIPGKIRKVVRPR